MTKFARRPVLTHHRNDETYVRQHREISSRVVFNDGSTFGNFSCPLPLSNCERVTQFGAHVHILDPSQLCHASSAAAQNIMITRNSRIISPRSVVMGFCSSISKGPVRAPNCMKQAAGVLIFRCAPFSDVEMETYNAVGKEATHVSELKYK